MVSYCWELARHSNCLKVVQKTSLRVPFTVMVLSFVTHHKSTQMDSGLTDWIPWRALRGRKLVPGVLEIWEQLQWSLTRAKMSWCCILLIMMAMIENLLMSVLVLTSTLLPVIVKPGLLKCQIWFCELDKSCAAVECLCNYFAGVQEYLFLSRIFSIWGSRWSRRKFSFRSSAEIGSWEHINYWASSWRAVPKRTMARARFANKKSWKDWGRLEGLAFGVKSWNSAHLQNQAPVPLYLAVKYCLGISHARFVAHSFRIDYILCR